MKKVNRDRLIAAGTCAKDERGRIVFTVASTERMKELVNDYGWNRGNESWISYRNRTRKERNEEERKVEKLTKDLVNAYNKYYKLQ